MYIKHFYRNGGTAGNGQRRSGGMKRKTAKEILADSFQELAQGKTIDRITIRDIIENCAYSQATFYRQFKDKYDLIAWSYTRDLDAILEQLKGDAPSWRQALESAAAYFAGHRKYLANLLTHTSGYDSLINNMTEIHSKCLQKTLDRLADKQRMDDRIRLYAQIYCYGTVLFSCDWILGKYDLSEKELADVYAEALPEPLRAYIL